MRSNFCGVYSTANALRLCGNDLSRREILRAFGTTSPYRGATHDEIRDVFSSLARAAARWEFRDDFDFRWLLRQARRQFEITPVTLLSFNACYRQRYHGTHVVVVVGAAGGLLHVIDPLCRGKATLSSVQWMGGEVVAPGPYTIDTTGSSAILRWAYK